MSYIGDLVDYLILGQQPPFEWVVAHMRDGSLQALWNASRDADDMLRLYIRTEDRAGVVRAACACAREALAFVAPRETRPRRAIEAAEAWTRGQATVDAVEGASDRAEVNGRALSQQRKYAAAYAALAASYAARTAIVDGYVQEAVDFTVTAIQVARPEGECPSRHVVLRRLAKVVRDVLPVAPKLAELTRVL